MGFESQIKLRYKSTPALLLIVSLSLFRKSPKKRSMNKVPVDKVAFRRGRGFSYLEKRGRIHNMNLLMTNGLFER